MAGNGVDRRWSPIELKHTLLHWVQERKGLKEQDAKNWLLDNDWVARNRDEVGKWFNSLIAKGLPERRPEPLHTAGYADLTDSQKGPLEDLVDIIDGHADVQYLMGDLVYEAYRQLQKRTNPSGRPLGRNKFYKTLEVYLEKQWRRPMEARPHGRIQRPGTDGEQDETEGHVPCRGRGADVFRHVEVRGLRPECPAGAVQLCTQVRFGGLMGLSLGAF